jgi:competence protein ComEA
MNLRGTLVVTALGTGMLYPIFAAVAIPAQQSKDSSSKDSGAPKDSLPPGEGKDLLLKSCLGCHELNVVTVERKTESGWTDTVVEMRNRGANGTDEDMELIIHYLTTNFGPETGSKVNINSANAADIAQKLSLSKADADAIVAYRDKNGKYKEMADLKQVPGVDAAKIEAAKDLIEF